MKKRVFYTEIAYFLALAMLAIGTALTAYGDFGVSMVVAPAYVLHLKLSPALPWFSFGMAGYTLQAVVLAALMLLMRKVRLRYFLSFVTAVGYGFALDGAMRIVGLLPENLILQVVLYVAGALLCCGGLSFLFCTYLPPEAYELFVKELSQKLNKPVHKVKIAYDCCSLAVAVLLSLLLFGALRGIGIGTAVCAFLYGPLIRLFQKLYGRRLQFADKFPARKYFEEKEEA